VAPAPAWCGGSRGPRMAHEAGDSLPVWLTTRSRLVTCYTGAAATGARLLNLHRSFSHQVVSHTSQPPSFRAAATTACVAARAAMPNSEEGSIYQLSICFNLIVGCLLSPLDLCNTPTTIVPIIPTRITWSLASLYPCLCRLEISMLCCAFAF